MKKLKISAILVIAIVLLVACTTAPVEPELTPSEPSPIVAPAPTTLIVSPTPTQIPTPRPLLVPPPYEPNQVNETITKFCDLDGDGAEEEVTATIYFNSEYRDNRVEITVKTASGGVFETALEHFGGTPSLNIADFDTRDEFVQFYIVWPNFPNMSEFYHTQIYTFDGMRIIENTEITGSGNVIVSFDGLGRIFTRDCIYGYYDLNNGLMPMPKEEIVGTGITRLVNLPLVVEPGYGAVFEFESENFVKWLHGKLDVWEEVYYNERFGDNLVCVVPKYTPLIVLDVEFESVEKEMFDDVDYVPWIKVRTPEGLEGWFQIL